MNFRVKWPRYIKSGRAGMIALYGLSAQVSVQRTHANLGHLAANLGAKAANLGAKLSARNSRFLPFAKGAQGSE